jgi:hypothetical protein
MSQSVWRSFLSPSDEADGAPTKDVQLLRSARQDAKAAKEDAKVKEEQLELMTAMLHAAEEELKLRSNQLDLTNAMLRATEAELTREEISKGDQERRSLRQQLAAQRDDAKHKQNRNSHRASSCSASSPPRSRAASGSSVASVPASARDAAAGCRCAAAAEAAAASSLAASLARVGSRAAGAGAALPIELPEQRGSRAPRIVLSHSDSTGAMRPKSPILDARETVVNYIESRARGGGRLPPTRTSMRIDHSDPDRGEVNE